MSSSSFKSLKDLNIAELSKYGVEFVKPTGDPRPTSSLDQNDFSYQVKTCTFYFINWPGVRTGFTQKIVIATTSLIPYPDAIVVLTVMQTNSTNVVIHITRKTRLKSMSMVSLDFF